MALGAPMENKWPECDLSDCDFATIPGTPLRLPFRKGIPFTILQAFLRDLNEFVESANNSRGYSDEGSWTDNNSVYTSNHKGGTAFDYNWDDHPMGVALAGWHGSDLVPGEQEPAVRDLLHFYTYNGVQLVWWGNDWKSPKDSMHFQMGYDTANNIALCNEFISKYIRPDGFSTYRRGNGPVAVPSEMTVPLVEEGNGRWTSPSPAWAHLIMRESGGDFTVVQHGYVDANTGGNEAEGGFQITPKTWRAHNGTQFAASPKLATPQQQAIVAARIFTRNPSGSDWGAGLPGRENAKELAAGLVPTGGTQDQGDDMAQVPQAQWDRALFLLEQTAGVFRESRSPLRHLGEGPVNTSVGFAQGADGLTHPQFVKFAASVGHLDSLALLVEVAGADPVKDADRQEDAQLAAGILRELSVEKPDVLAAGLAQLESTKPQLLQAYLAKKGAA